LCALCFVVFLIVAGCNFGAKQDSEEQRQRDEKTRDEAAKVTERAKPEIEAAGRALGRAAEAAAEDAHAAGQGIREGWKQRGHEPLDLNSASEGELSELPGISPRAARRMTRERPYRSKRELVTKGILSEDAYARIRDDVTVK
jgi:hypothetical protein